MSLVGLGIRHWPQEEVAVLLMRERTSKKGAEPGVAGGHGFALYGIRCMMMERAGVGFPGDGL